MKISKHIILIIALVVTSIIAVPANKDMARDVAEIQIELFENYFLENVNSANYGVDFQIAECVPISRNSRVLGYVHNLEPRGYIVVTGQTDLIPVIAYSFENNFSFEDAPENVLLHMLTQDLEFRNDALKQTDSNIKNQNNSLWKAYLDDDSGLERRYESMIVYGPWVDTHWSQGSPYNAYCPIDPSTGGRCITGCTATAMGQILNYWEYPEFVKFSEDNSYWSSYTSPSIWIDAPSASIMAIEYNYSGTDDPSVDMMARLLFAAGVSVYSSYSSSGTGASVVGEYYRRNWGYGAAYSMDGDHTSFYDDLCSNMIDGQPAQLSIYQAGWTGGHSIVCDGYNTTGVYHLNMGWGGSSDSWYSLPYGMPSGYSIISRAVMGIYPTPLVDIPNTCSEAYPIYPSAEVEAKRDAIYPTGEEDWYSFHASAESTYLFYTSGNMDTYGEIYESCSGSLMVANGGGMEGGNFYLQFYPTVDGEYYLRITGETMTEYGYYKIHYLTGSGPYVEVINPNGGEDLDEGANQLVQWNKGGVPSFNKVKIEYSLSGEDGPWVSIVDSTSSGFYIWEVPQVDADVFDSYIRISSIKYAVASDISDGPITIRNIAGIQSADKPEEFGLTVYPNPFNSSCRIECPDMQKIAIYDIRGSVVCEENLPGDVYNWEPDENCGSGVYYIDISDGISSIREKLIYLK